VLRAPDRATDGPEQSPAAPQPGLAQATALVASIRAAGTPVTLRHSGEPVSLEPGVDLAAYRIVQEALTNVTKHTPRGTAATVDVAWTGQALSLRIANPAPASGRPAAAGLTCGYGLLGIRERAALAGGDLSAGHTADGGFEVCATLPTTTPAGAPPLAVQPGTGKERP
jgi:signal transduction histidine kinase